MLTLLSFLPLVTTALALPTTSLLESRHLATRDAETWSIPTLNFHFMTSNDGLPGGGWPADQTHFNSTLDFTIDTLSNSATCHASFANGTLPTSTFPCTTTSNSSQLSFTMTPYSGPGAGGRPELSFVLTILSYVSSSYLLPRTSRGKI